MICIYALAVSYTYSTGLGLLSTYRYLEQLAFVAANFCNPFFPSRFQLWKQVKCNFSSAGYVFVVTPDVTVSEDVPMLHEVTRAIR